MRALAPVRRAIVAMILLHPASRWIAETAFGSDQRDQTPLARTSARPELTVSSYSALVRDLRFKNQAL